MARFALAVWHRPWLGVLIVFLAAAWQRWCLPWLPLADPDTWGYLNPALQDLAGNGLVQTHCRGMAYPLFLRVILGITGSFGAIAPVQHGIGLISGLLWLAAFRLWLAWLPVACGPWPRWLAAACLALYLCNPATLAQETQIRPEAIFPFFALAQITATLVFARVRWRGGTAAGVALAGGAAALLALVCLGLKPSWGFAAAVPFAVIAAGMLAKGTAAVRLAPPVMAGLFVAMWLLAVPRLAGWIPERDCGGFLAGTLFTIHADVISREMNTRRQRGQLTTAEEKFLEKLERRLAESRTLEKSAFLILGHDADYLFYRSDTLVALPDVPPGDPAAAARYLRNAYFAAWRGEPRLMASKVARQMVAAYGDASKSVFSRSVQWQAMFTRTDEALGRAELPVLPETIQSTMSATLAETRRSAAAQPKALAAAWAPPTWLLRGPLTWLLWGAVVGGGALLVLLPWRANTNVPKFLDHCLGQGGTAVPAVMSSDTGGTPVPPWPAQNPRAKGCWYNTPAWHPWLPAVWAFGIVWACAVGSALTVAVVHSFDIDRYLMLQSSVNALLLAVGTSLAVAWVTTRMRPRAP